MDANKRFDDAVFRMIMDRNTYKQFDRRQRLGSVILFPMSFLLVCMGLSIIKDFYKGVFCIVLGALFLVLGIAIRKRMSGGATICCMAEVICKNDRFTMNGKVYQIPGGRNQDGNVRAQERFLARSGEMEVWAETIEHFLSGPERSGRDLYKGGEEVILYSRDKKMLACYIFSKHDNA